MRILTVRQPWAWAIINAGKDVENRPRNIAGDYTGDVAIHAALQWSEPDGDDWELRRAIRSEDQGYPADDGQVWSSGLVEEHDPRFALRGAIIGVVTLTGTHLSRPGDNGPVCFDGHTPTGHLCSPWAQTYRGGNHHLQLTNPRALAASIPFTGALGLRRLDEETTQLIELQLGKA